MTWTLQLDSSVTVSPTRTWDSSCGPCQKSSLLDCNCTCFGWIMCWLICPVQLLMNLLQHQEKARRMEEEIFYGSKPVTPGPKRFACNTPNKTPNKVRKVWRHIHIDNYFYLLLCAYIDIMFAIILNYIFAMLVLQKHEKSVLRAQPSAVTVIDFSLSVNLHLCG